MCNHFKVNCVLSLLLLSFSLLLEKTQRRFIIVLLIFVYFFTANIITYDGTNTDHHWDYHLCFWRHIGVFIPFRQYWCLFSLLYHNLCWKRNRWDFIFPCPLDYWCPFSQSNDHLCSVFLFNFASIDVPFYN